MLTITYVLSDREYLVHIHRLDHLQLPEGVWIAVGNRNITELRQGLTKFISESPQFSQHAIELVLDGLRQIGTPDLRSNPGARESMNAVEEIAQRDR